jgi:hypothetical protein
MSTKKAAKRATGTTKKTKDWSMNPLKWIHLDNVGASEVSAIRDHAEAVWYSGEDNGDPPKKREVSVRASLEEMREWLDTILGPRFFPTPPEIARRMVAAAIEPDLDRGGPVQGPLVMYTMTNCAKCGKRIRQDKAVTSEDASGKVWDYCSARCERNH